MLLDGEATVAIAHCQQEDEIKEKDLPPSRRLVLRLRKTRKKPLNKLEPRRRRWLISNGRSVV